MIRSVQSFYKTNNVYSYCLLLQYIANQSKHNSDGFTVNIETQLIDLIEW